MKLGGAHHDVAHAHHTPLSQLVEELDVKAAGVPTTSSRCKHQPNNDVINRNENHPSLFKSRTADQVANIVCCQVE